MTENRLNSDTRERILDFAERQFMAHGYEGTSMRVITSAAGVNLAAVCTGKLDRAAWEARTYPGLRIFPDFAAFVATLT